MMLLALAMQGPFILSVNDAVSIRALVMLLALVMQGPFTLTISNAVSISDVGSIHTDH